MLLKWLQFELITLYLRKVFMARVKKETQEKVSALMDRANDIWQEVLPKLNQIQKEFSEIGEGATTRNKKLERVIKYFSTFVENSTEATASTDN